MAKGPGKHHRTGISLVEIMDMFPTDQAAREWFEETRWGGEPACTDCGSVNVQCGAKHPSQTHRCRDCRKFFSVTKGTAMERTKLGLRTWAIAIYLMSTELKGRASMKLRRDLGITQKAAWHLAHRLRQAWEDEGASPFSGPVEVDEAFFGGKRKNMSLKRRKELKEQGLGRGPAGKTAVVAAKDRGTNRVAARVVENVDQPTLADFVDDHASPSAALFTDDSSAYAGGRRRWTVKHSAAEYVRYLEGVKVHTNGVESFWSMLKRAHTGTFHRLSPKHLQRYVSEFAGRHNIRDLDTIDQMRTIARGLEGKRLRFKDLTADTGEPGEAT